MILRKLADAIREQKWFTVFIELLIVIFGVYIGLYLSGEQQAIDHRKETMQALAALEAEFRSDLARVDEIIEFQKQRQAQYKQAMDLLTNASVHGEKLGPLLRTVAGGQNDTFYPNRAAYDAMRTGGYLSALTNEKLRIHITRLIEREYIRQYLNADYYDELLLKNFGMDIIANNWNFETNTPLEENSVIVIRNGIASVLGQGLYYLNFLISTIRPDIQQALDMIDEFQDEESR